MQVSPVQQQDGSTGLNTGGPSTSTTAIKGLSQDDFLKLLLTQLQAQDPLKPLDNQEFAAQLATFNSLDQLIGINKKLEATQGQQLQLSQLEATTLIGKEVSAKGNNVSLSEGKAATLHYALDANAGRVVVNIKDNTGNLVRALEVGSQKAGKQSVIWDGKDTAGKPLGSGTYTFEVKALDESGNKVGTSTFIRGLVTGVDMAGSEPQLEVGGVEIPVSAVISVHTAADGNSTQTSQGK
jgi:flagellar basal-body rod modification protein FlgD